MRNQTNDNIKHYKDKITFANLDDIISGDFTQQKELQDARILLLWSTEIDEVGGSISIDMLDYPGEILEKVVTAIEFIANLGFSKIVVSTDHGFLIIPQPQDVNVLETFTP